MVVGLYLDSRATGEQARTQHAWDTDVRIYGVHTHIAAYATSCVCICVHTSRRVASRRVASATCIRVHVSTFPETRYTDPRDSYLWYWVIPWQIDRWHCAVELRHESSTLERGRSFRGTCTMRWIILPLGVRSARSTSRLCWVNFRGIALIPLYEIC